MKRIVFYALLMFVFTTSFGQKWQETSYKMFLNEYTNLLSSQPKELYEVSMNTSVYETFTDAVPVVKQKSQLSVFKENNYKYSSEGAIQIQKGELKLDIDTLEKRVMLSNGINSDLLGYNPNQFDHIDSTRYNFYLATDNSKTYLKVIEKNQVSSMQIVCFVFDKNNHHLVRMEMTYWPGNFKMASLNDESIEQPKVLIDYVDFRSLISSESLDKEFSYWISKKSGSKEYDCPQSNYTFYNLLKK